MLSLYLSGLIPSDTLFLLKEKLANLNAKQKELIELANFKKTNITLALSLSLGCIGVDRYYLGDIVLGVVKSIGFILFVIFLGLSDAEGSFGHDSIDAIVGLFILVYFLFCFSDIFLCQKRAKEINLQKLKEILMLTEI
ncbi:NINE protein [Gallibacterium trehalosifermentans]|uniref:NINE protein n=1 Tax=Gallibacterium trehalosifermentans TaxID=516935 RepID=A0ABV6H1L2_9PAST